LNGSADLASFGLSGRSFITVLTGAGVSAECGIPTFRGEGGLWKTYRAEDLATPGAFSKDPGLVWEWYDYRRSICACKDPNPAHHAISRLDKSLEKFLLITQNVDNLHGRAGTRRMVELHGNLFRARCVRCGSLTSSLPVPLPEIPPVCSCGGMLRPDVVWFGEALPERAILEATEASRTCDLMVVAGTSAVVQPAASMPLLAKQAGAHVIEVNPAPTPLTPFVDCHLEGKAGEVMPGLVDSILEVVAG
jgi:NAD-dependent deacetylase